MASYALIGGRSSSNRENFLLEEKIFQFLAIQPKQILFVPFANENIIDAIQKFKTLVPKEYYVKYLTSLDEAEEAFEESDIIYFGGGSTERLVALANSSVLSYLLKKYKESSKLFMGISAGANLFSVAGMGDQYSYKNGNYTYNYQMVRGLGILPLTLCPHYDHEGIECYNESLKSYPFDGFALEDDTAILIHSHIHAFKMNSSKSVYSFRLHENYKMVPMYEHASKECAVLGPKGTYSDLAKDKLSYAYKAIYFPSIFSVCDHVNQDRDAFIPLENTLDGFVMESLDSILKYNLHILEQVKLKVDFQFVSFEKDLRDIQEVYVQFKAYGQCQDFILQHKLIPIFTQSNIESLNLILKKDRPKVGAILPEHVNTEQFSLVEKNILGNVQDETRFVLVSKEPLSLGLYESYTCSLAIIPKEDKSGVLFNILKKFHDQGFNLKAILSRPKKDMMGNYIFYFEFDLKKEEIRKVFQLQENIKKEEQSVVKILGIYNIL